MTEEADNTKQDEGLSFAQALNLYVSSYSIARMYGGHPMSAGELTGGLISILVMICNQFGPEDRMRLVDACCESFRENCECGADRPSRESMN